MFAVLAVPAVAQEVYFVPQESKASYCNTAEVEIWVNAEELKSGQINMTYDPSCANVTKYVWNATNFPMSGWSHFEGREWITFMTLMPSLSGNYQIGTLTIHCVNPSLEGCTTPLEFIDGSKLFDPYGAEIAATWTDGTFKCTVGPLLCTSPDPPSHDFGSVPFGETRTWTFDITNCGGGTLTWTVSDDQPWITVSPASGTTTTETDTVTVTIDTTGLACDATHTGTITVNSNDGTKTGTISVYVPPCIIENEVYLVPQHSVARGYCKTTNVEIRVNATGFQSGQINLTYSPDCANVTNCVLNTVTFPISGWVSSVKGSEWITFMATAELTGDYWIANLTMHCVNDSKEGCTTPLDFTDPSALFNFTGDKILATWKDGTFNCPTPIPTPIPTPTPTATPPLNGGDSGGGGGGARILFTPTPTLTPTLSPTPTPLTPTPTSSLAPTLSLTPTPTLTPIPSPTSKPRVQGFEALFAILGLLAVAYLLRRK